MSALRLSAWRSGANSAFARRRLSAVFAAMLIGVALVLAPRAQAIDPLPFADRAEELRFQSLAKQLRCLQCQNESLAEIGRAHV